MKKYLYLINPFISFCIIGILWEVGAHSLKNELLIPGIIPTFHALLEILKESSSRVIILTTLGRGVLSFGIAFIAGTILGGITWYFPPLKIIVHSIINLLKRVPTIGIIIISLIWFDVSMAPFMIGIIVTLPLIFEAVIGGIESVSHDFILMAKVYSPTPWKMFKSLYIPLIFTYMAPVLSSVLGLTFKTVIAGEVLAQLSNSIGGEIFLEKIYLNTSKVFAWIIIVLLFNWFLEFLLKKINFYCRKLYLII